MPVRELPTGTIVRHHGFWGVLGPWKSSSRLFDAWDCPSYMIRRDEYVEVSSQSTVRPK